MDMLLPRISVIVPVYNAGRTLAQCLESLQRQTDSGYEVIVVDDRSTDDSRDIARSIGEKAGFRLIELEINKGQAVARNQGAKVATGDILAFVDADVVVPDDWLVRYRRLLEESGVDVICGGYLVSTGDPPAALFASHEAFFRRLSLPSLRLRTLTSANCVMYRRVFEEAGGFPEYYIDARRDPATQKAASINEDSELGFLIAGHGGEIRWTHDNHVRHFFPDTWRGYLAQQLAASRAGALSVFRFPKMLVTKDLYGGEPIVPQLVVMLLMLLSPVWLLLGWEGLWAMLLILAGGLLFFALYHLRFLRYLGPGGMGSYGRHRVFFWMVVTRIVWVYGVALGIQDGIRMRWSHDDGKGS
jgi:glycosyltransferase involved in cell wall biosynthesis